jgi:RNA polymerase sporulation-specific sigma factor
MAKKSFYKILTDDELFLLLKNDKSAENEFYRRYKIRVKGFLKNYRLNSLEREDLIQEGMIGLFHAIETYDTEKNVKFSTYSNVCIKNRIYNSLHSLWAHKKKFDDQKDIEEIESRNNPESDTISTEISEELKAGISSLTGLERKVLDEYMGRKSYKSIASELEISTKKVDNILMKIKSKLSRYIQGKNDTKRKKV